MKKFLKLINLLIVKYWGFEISKVPEAFYDQKKILKAIDVNVIFDVGANIGQTTTKYRRLFPLSTIYSFEPFPQSFELLNKSFFNDDKVIALPLAMSNEDGLVDLFSYKNNMVNSLFPISENAKKWHNENIVCKDSEKKQPVKTVTLENFCIENNINEISILKMDIQGGELKVLESSASMLSSQNILLIYMEIQFAPLYEGQPHFYEIDEFLKSFGYIFYGFYKFRFSKQGSVKYSDAIYIAPKILNAPL